MMWISLLWTLVAVLVCCIVLCTLLANAIIFPRKFSYEDTFRKGVMSGEINENTFHQYRKEEVFIDSYHGYEIHGMLFSVAESKKAILIAHGITWSLFGSLKYVPMFQRMGYSVLLCDHRYHGLSGGDHTSFGYFEKDDFKAWIDFLEEKFGKGAVIGVLGESLGAASALQCIKEETRIAYCIADCAFHDFTSLLRLRLVQDFRVRFYPLITITSLIIKFRCGWSFSQISPIKGLENISTPILFIHGSDDSFIPVEMSRKMYKLAAGLKRLYLVPKAEHAKAFLTDPKRYEKMVGDFIKEVENKQLSLKELS